MKLHLEIFANLNDKRSLAKLIKKYWNLSPSYLLRTIITKILIQNNMNIKSSIEKIDDENLNIKMNGVYNKLSDHLVKKIRLASDNGKDKDALKVIKKIFNDE